jgi:uncharacterized protein YjlB
LDRREFQIKRLAKHDQFYQKSKNHEELEYRKLESNLFFGGKDQQEIRITNGN